MNDYNSYTWLVVLWHRSKIVAGDSLDRLTKMASEQLQQGKIPTSPTTIVSRHTSARAADRAAAKLAERLKSDGWWNAENSAQVEERNQEDQDHES